MSDWQPIETAPRDGTQILLFLEDGQYASAEFGLQSDGTTRWEIAQTKSGKVCLAGLATHWMPLPEPPKVPTSAENVQLSSASD